MGLQSTEIPIITTAKPSEQVPRREKNRIPFDTKIFLGVGSNECQMHTQKVEDLIGQSSEIPLVAISVKLLLTRLRHGADKESDTLGRLKTMALTYQHTFIVLADTINKLRRNPNRRLERLCGMEAYNNRIRGFAAEVVFYSAVCKAGLPIEIESIATEDADGIDFKIIIPTGETTFEFPIDLTCSYNLMMLNEKIKGKKDRDAIVLLLPMPPYQNQKGRQIGQAVKSGIIELLESCLKQNAPISAKDIANGDIRLGPLATQFDEQDQPFYTQALARETLRLILEENLRYFASLGENFRSNLEKIQSLYATLIPLIENEEEVQED